MLEKIKAALSEALAKLDQAIATADAESARIHAHIVRALHDLL